MNRHESYVSLELAKMLKTARFDWVVNSRWENWNLYPKDKDFFLNTNLGEYENINETGGFCAFSAPTLDVAQRWLREVKDTYVIPQISDYEANGCIWEYDYRVGIHNINPIRSLSKYKSYEEALEAGIKKCLTLILEKNE